MTSIIWQVDSFFNWTIQWKRVPNGNRSGDIFKPQRQSTSSSTYSMYIPLLASWLYIMKVDLKWNKYYQSWTCDDANFPCRKPINVMIRSRDCWVEPSLRLYTRHTHSKATRKTSTVLESGGKQITRITKFNSRGGRKGMKRCPFFITQNSIVVDSKFDQNDHQTLSATLE